MNSWTRKSTPLMPLLMRRHGISGQDCHRVTTAPVKLDARGTPVPATDQGPSVPHSVPVPTNV